MIMKAIDSEDMKALITAVLVMANKLIETRQNPAIHVTDEEYKKAMQEEQALRNLADILVARLIILEGEKVDEAISEMRSATKKTNEAINNIKIIKGAIEVAAALIELAGAVISKNPGGIISASKKLYDTVLELPA
jgi:hypothetical protein